MKPLFEDRAHAGRSLALALVRYSEVPDVLVLGLPRGGVPVAAEVAAALHAPLDVLVVRKLGVPGQEEYAMGAIASGGITVMNPELSSAVHEAHPAVRAVIERERHELERRELAYRGERVPIEVEGRPVIVVDDGLATGSTMRAAVLALRRRNPARVVVAVPVAAASTCAALGELADEVVCVATPEPFEAVGCWYEVFDQTSDDEVRVLLRAASDLRRGARIVLGLHDD